MHTSTNTETEPKKVPVTMRLPKDLDERLERICDQEERTKNWVVCKALQSYLEERSA